MTQNIPLAIGLVLVGSFCFAMSAHLQHGAVDRHLGGNRRKDQMSFRSFLVAVRSRRWLLGLVLLGVSAVFQILALTLAPLTVVQPLGLLAFPWSVLLAAHATRTWVPPRIQLAVAVTVVATLAFTVVTGVHASASSDLVIRRVIIGALAVYAVVGLFSTLGAKGPHHWRSLFWSSGGALFYGLEASLVKSLIEYVRTHSWPYSPAIFGIVVALVVGAVAAGWLIQQGYATGPAEVVVGSMTVTSPVVAVAFGILVLGEGAGITLDAAVWMVILGAIAVMGVVALARFHPSNHVQGPPEPGATAASQLNL